VPAVGSTALQPGESTEVFMRFMMHGDMGGKHNFRVHLLSDDPTQPEQLLTVLSNWVD